MTDDRTLLEKAAKAAGIEIRDWNGDSAVYFVDHWSGNPSEEPQYEPVYWNPLADDGDALRLAVLRRIDIKFYPGLPFNGLPNRVICGIAYKQETQCAEGYADDPMPAIRLAITRSAAASIGETP